VAKAVLGLWLLMGGSDVGLGEGAERKKRGRGCCRSEGAGIYRRGGMRRLESISVGGVRKGMGMSRAWKKWPAGKQQR
jgi:hypothetical protein